MRRPGLSVCLALAGLLAAVACSGGPSRRASAAAQLSPTTGSFTAADPRTGVVVGGGDFTGSNVLDPTTTATTAPGPPLGEPGAPVGTPAQALVAHRLSDLPGGGVGSASATGTGGAGPVVALTFDDGPDPANTPAVLDVLARYGATSTFFMLGRSAVRFGDLVRRVAAAGHSVAGHTWNHVDLTRLPEAQYAFEVDRTNELLASLSGKPVRCVRPPGGHEDGRVASLLGQRHLVTMMWSIDPRDWKEPPATDIAGYVLAGLHPGAVIILHDGGGDRSHTVAALPIILDGLRQRGYHVVPICT